MKNHFISLIGTMFTQKILVKEDIEIKYKKKLLDNTNKR